MASAWAAKNPSTSTIHGTQDPQAPLERARESRPVFERFGVDLAYHEFAMGHEIRPEAMTAMVRWLREKV